MQPHTDRDKAARENPGYFRGRQTRKNHTGIFHAGDYFHCKLPVFGRQDKEERQSTAGIANFVKRRG
jgi:hypothetical protein